MDFQIYLRHEIQVPPAGHQHRQFSCGTASDQKAKPTYRDKRLLYREKTNALALSRLPFQPCPWASCHNSQPHSLHLATVLCCRLLKISDPRPCVDIQSWFNGSVSLPQQPAWSLQLVVQFIRCDLAMLRAGVIYGFQASHSHERKSKCHQKVCTLEIFTKRQRCSVLPRG